MRKLGMKIKTRLHWSYSIVSIIVLLVTGIIILLTTQGRISRKLDRELTQTNLLVYKMVENVFDINKNILLNNLKIFEKQVSTISIDKTKFIESDAEHYITQLTDYIQISTMNVNDKSIFEDTVLVDTVADITGGNVSILQLVPHGLLRISSNIFRPDGSRATQTYYPNDHKITSTIRAGEMYIDKTFEMGEWHIVAYKPVILHGNVLGALQVGIKPDIDSLRKHIQDIRIGQTGIPFIVDTEGILVLGTGEENENVYHLPHIKKMINDRGNGTLIYKIQRKGFKRNRKMIIAYQYLPDMEWIVASGSYLDEFYGELGLISWIISISIITALLLIILVSLILAENLSEPIKLLTGCMSDLREIKYDFSNFNTIDQIRKRINNIEISEDEIQVMASTFSKMLEELEDAQRQLISKHRRYRETELVRKVDEILLPDFEKLQDQGDLSNGVTGEDAAGTYFDMSPGPDGQTWYLVGTSEEQSETFAIFMMMAQSSLNSILKEIPDASPFEVVRMLNGYFAGEINRRIKGDQNYQISLIVSSSSGWVSYAGPQSILRLYRSDDIHCEIIKTQPHSHSDSEMFNIHIATFRILQGNLLLLGADVRAADLSKVIHKNWDKRAEELNTMFLEHCSDECSGKYPSFFLLKKS
jgi:hypothetical protein